MITFPALLPKPSTESYKIEPASGTVRTEFASGEAKHRRIRTNPPDTYTIIWDMNPNEFSIFEVFVNHELHDASEWFTMSHYGGLGYQDGVFRFKEVAKPYVVENIGPRDFKVTAILERQNRVNLNKIEYQLKILQYESQFPAFVDRFHIDVNTHLPYALAETSPATPINFGGQNA